MAGLAMASGHRASSVVDAPVLNCDDVSYRQYSRLRAASE